MTAPTSPSPDSLAAVSADIGKWHDDGERPDEWKLAEWKKRIERLDAEMRERLAEYDGRIDDCVDELDSLPKRLLLNLSAATIGPYAVKLRGQRNRYRLESIQAQDKATRAVSAKANAEGGCMRLKEENTNLRAKLAACEGMSDDELESVARNVVEYFDPYMDCGPSNQAHISKVRGIVLKVISSRAAPNDISTPRPTDCADIREGRVTVLARDQKGEACMTMVKR